MGLFWDLMQQSAINKQQEKSQSLEARVRWLENELNRTQTLLAEVIRRLETQSGEDINKDGRIG